MKGFFASLCCLKESSKPTDHFFPVFITVRFKCFTECVCAHLEFCHGSSHIFPRLPYFTFVAFVSVSVCGNFVPQKLLICFKRRTIDTSIFCVFITVS